MFMKRNIDERRLEVKKIIKKLTELQLTIIYDPIKKLFEIMKKYVDNESPVKINIPFPEIKKNIVGYLHVDKNQECWVKLTSNK
tara:strand:- start:787 stop:1038 length:252 start_codon:yes stop_codon:yes gene_type:complete